MRCVVEVFIILHKSTPNPHNSHQTKTIHVSTRKPTTLRTKERGGNFYNSWWVVAGCASVGNVYYVYLCVYRVGLDVSMQSMRAGMSERVGVCLHVCALTLFFMCVSIAHPSNSVCRKPKLNITSAVTRIDCQTSTHAMLAARPTNYPQAGAREKAARNQISMLTARALLDHRFLKRAR